MGRSFEASRCKLSSWDFDYRKSGIWKYLRARLVFLVPRWEWWLRIV